MKRKLQRAYDTMAMPDDCARRIEQHLLIRQQQQKTGWYTQVVMPATRPKHSWVTAVSAVSAVCMMLVLFAGGTIFCLRTMNMEVKQPVQVPSTASQTASGDYSLVTDIPAEEVEAFAQEIRKNIWEDNWELFASQVHYPIEIQDKTIENEGGLTGLLLRNTVSSDFLEEVRKESCNQMFCNWQGICMGNGRIWINEVDGVLKITAINGMFTDLVDPMDMEYSELPDGNYAVTSFSGRVEGITFPTGYNRHIVTQIGTGQPVLESGDAIKSVTIPESVTVIGDYAFADCEALESVHFRGDAPAEAEGVFEGSGNVTVYYPEGTSGWGDTWCGRKTAVYTHLSLGTIFDPATPGTLMYGSVENDQLASIGYYISCEYGELQAEIRRLNTDAPVYKVGSHLELLDSHGTTVSSVGELLDYLRAERLQKDRSRDVPRIMALSEEYARCYLAGDTDGMAALTSLTSSQKPAGYPGDGKNGKILNISLTGTMVLEDTASVSICIQEPDQTDSWSFLMLILVREGEDWKVQSCALEK